MVGEVIAGRYELEELLGAGGMANVYLARDRTLERRVALKVLHAHHTDDEQYLERFRREARAVARLSHPNIVTVIDRGEDEGRQYIVFEYVEGETLKRRLDERGPLPVREAFETAIQVARGLAFAHENGIVHRDVKPQNVLLDDSGAAKVTDFGIARSLDVEGVTQSGTVLGTSNYISPEQATGGEIGPATDVYSLGAVVYELLTGELPFTGESFVAVAMRHVHEPPPSLLERRPDVPLRVAAAVERALEKDPADRFPSMVAFADELEACLGEPLVGSGEEAPTLIGPGASVRPRRRERRRSRAAWLPTALLVAGALLLAAAGVGLVISRGSDGFTTGAAVKLTGVASYDPPPGGDGREHDERVKDATDGDPETYWTTETYRSFGKPGVGLVLDAGDSVRLEGLTIRTDTPGFTAQIRSGSSRQGPFDPVSTARSVGASTDFELSTKAARYYLVWITNPGPEGRARINEVRAG